MNNTANNTAPHIVLMNNIPVASSLEIAERFGIPHEKLLKTIHKARGKHRDDYADANYILGGEASCPCFYLSKRAFEEIACFSHFYGSKGHEQYQLFLKQYEDMLPKISDVARDALQRIHIMKRDLYSNTNELVEKLTGTICQQIREHPGANVWEPVVRSMCGNLSDYLLIVNKGLMAADSIVMSLAEMEKALRLQKKGKCHE